MAAHPIVHVEIPAHDPQAAGAFYNGLFGWPIHHSAELDYTMFGDGDGPGGGFPQKDSPMDLGGVIVHIGTDDIGASLAKAESLGGKTVVPSTEIPGTGWFAVFEDLSGNRIGLYKGLKQ